jgi:hypothetical protein
VADLKRNIVFVGVALLVIGIIAIILSSVPIPFTEQEEYDRLSTELLLWESFDVPVGTTHRIAIFKEGDKVNIDFTVTSGGDLDVDFICKKGENIILSLDRVNSYNGTVTIPDDGPYYFIWDNSFSVLTTKTVSAKLFRLRNEIAYRDITSHHTIVPSEYSAITTYSGIALVLAGIAVIFWGIVAKEET